jgi:hypothetical protein
VGNNKLVFTSKWSGAVLPIIPFGRSGMESILRASLIDPVGAMRMRDNRLSNHNLSEQESPS